MFQAPAPKQDVPLERVDESPAHQTASERELERFFGLYARLSQVNQAGEVAANSTALSSLGDHPELSPTATPLLRPPDNDPKIP